MNHIFLRIIYFSWMQYKINPRHSCLIGITGNICVGKSLALTIFQKNGFHTISMDAYVHHIMISDVYLKEKIVAKFPGSLINGSISREFLSNIIFYDRKLMNDLAEILIPYTKNKIQEISSLIYSHYGRAIVVEIPLLFENKREKYFDVVIYLGSSIKSMLNRALKRDNMTEKKFFAILNHQLPKKEVIHKVDYFIYNESKRYLLKSIKNIIYHGRLKRSGFRY